MATLLKPERLRRYAEIVALLVKYGRSDLVDKSAFSAPQSQPRASAHPPQAEELAADMEKLGATFIKLGQLLSTRGDLLPEPYLEALSRLQDQVEPFSFEEAE